MKLKYPIMGKTILLMLAFTFISFADVQFSSYSISPSSIKPGTSASVVLTLSNTGAYAVSGLTLKPSGYGFRFASEYIGAGDIGAGGSTTVSIPFIVSPTLDAGIYQLDVVAYWSGGTATSTGTTYKRFTIPITITNPAKFSALANIDKYVKAGDSFKVNITLKNDGGIAKNARAALNSSYFLLLGESQVQLGDIGSGSQVQREFLISVSSSTPAGTYELPITITYEDMLGTTEQASVSVSKVSVVKSSADFYAELEGSNIALEPGETREISLKITNTGNAEATSLRAALVPASAYFTPLGSSEQYVASLKPGESAQLRFLVGVSGEATPNYYLLSLILRYKDEHGEEQAPINRTIGLRIVSKPELDIIATTSPSPVLPNSEYAISFRVCNRGSGKVKSLSLHAESTYFQFLETPADYIGSLDADDYTTSQFKARAGNLNAGKYPINITLSFKDAYNIDHKTVKTAYIEVHEGVPSTGYSGYCIPIVAVVLLLLIYLGYRKFRKKSKKE